MLKLVIPADTARFFESGVAGKRLEGCLCNFPYPVCQEKLLAGLCLEPAEDGPVRAEES
jgi:hypothetical protein